MINRFLRHVKEGFVGVARHAAMAISSISAITITLLLISIFAMLTLNLESVTKNIEEDVKIFALVSYDYESDEDLARIKTDIESVVGVKTVTFSDKDDELAYYLASYDEDEQELFMPQGSENPMKHAYHVEVLEGAMIQTVAHTIEEIEGVSEINYGGDGALQLVDGLEAIRNGGFILVSALAILATYLVQNTIKLTILARNKEIWIMRNVGAKNGFIRVPFLIEGIIIGILGSIVPMLFTIFGYIYLYNITGGYILSTIFSLIPPHPFVLYVAAILLGGGVLVGFVGSFLSVTKYLRWRR